ncbi:glycerophosphodiester phosphodiesterase family protein [Thermococcus siculi]|nr:glycerophosphodiester phosphodiesterase family protein [Thermococcus siculi]
MDSENVFILGHRGIKGPLENTLPAFRRALRYADGIEFDVRLTGDGKLIAHHDPGFRSSGSFHLLREMSLRQIRRLHPKGMAIPTVERVFREFRGAIFNADLKETDAMEPALRITERFNATENTVFSSENPATVKALLRECPNCRVGFSIVGYGSVRWIPRLKGLYSVHVPIDAVSYVGYRNLLVLLRTLRKRGLKIYLWNYEMNEREWMPRLRRFADALILDDPSWVGKGFYG